MVEIIGDSVISGVSNKWVVEESIRLVKEAEEKDILIRIIGGIAVRLHSPDARRLYGKARPLTDIDYMTYSKYGFKVDDFFKASGYLPYMSSGSRAQRGIYAHEKHGLQIDVFYDKLDMCHKIEFKKNNRLEVDSPTIALADIVLEKLQIVLISAKDVKDVCILLREHEIGKTDNDEVNMKYINKLLSDDWGFYHTSTINLNKFKYHLTMEDGILYSWPEEDRNIIVNRIEEILDSLENYPKTRKWKRRAKTGTKKKWYKDVKL